jgi:hypothetical protein
MAIVSPSTTSAVSVTATGATVVVEEVDVTNARVVVGTTVDEVAGMVSGRTVAPRTVSPDITVEFTSAVSAVGASDQALGPRFAWQSTSRAFPGSQQPNSGSIA